MPCGYDGWIQETASDRKEVNDPGPDTSTEVPSLRNLQVHFRSVFTNFEFLDFANSRSFTWHLLI